MGGRVVGLNVGTTLIKTEGRVAGFDLGTAKIKKREGGWRDSICELQWLLDVSVGLE